VKRTLVLVLTHLVALLVGGTLGFAIGDRHDAAKVAPLDDFGAAMYSGMLASGERVSGTDASYENALRAHASFLKDLSARAASDSARQRYAADNALALIRLADLAEKRGASAESTRLTADALAVCATAGLPYCSSNELRQRARDVDAFLESYKSNKRDK
jgi:recombinational DNA repair protein (RecF pathway)